MFTTQSELRISEFKSTLVDLGTREFSFARKADLDEHIMMLAKEFSGLTQLELFHAATVVFLRRRMNTGFCLQNFREMWLSESDFLCQRLSSRWLISACDTIIDYFDDQAEVYAAVAGTLFMNTVKLYETEYYYTKFSPSFEGIDFRFERYPLFDGLTAYLPTHGNMIDNLIDRVKKTQPTEISSKILNELINRAHRFDTVFGRCQTFRKTQTDSTA